MNSSENEAPAVAVVVVTHNGADHLCACLRSLERLDYPAFTVTVVDNGSEDGTSERVAREFPAVRLIALWANCGFAGGTNAGIRATAEPLVALINDDAEADPFWLAALVRALNRDDSIGMCAPKIRTFDTSAQLDSTGLVIYFDGMARGRGRSEPDHGQYDRSSEVLVPSGAGALYRRDMLDQIGLFDERFETYAEDVDLGLRGRAAGWRAAYVPEAVVHHRFAATGRRSPERRLYLIERNRIWVAVKHLPLLWLVLSPLFTAVRYLAHAVAVLVRGSAAGEAARGVPLHRLVHIACRAWLDALRALPAMLRDRWRLRHDRRLSSMAWQRLLWRHRCPLRTLAWERWGGR